MNRNTRTLQIEARIKQGQPIAAIAREFAVDRRWVQRVRDRLLTDYEGVTCRMGQVLKCPTPATQIDSELHMKSLQLHLTPAVHDALVEAVEITNRKSPEDPITITEYVEELVINRVVELGLLRRNKRK